MQPTSPVRRFRCGDCDGQLGIYVASYDETDRLNLRQAGMTLRNGPGSAPGSASWVIGAKGPRPREVLSIWEAPDGRRRFQFTCYQHHRPRTIPVRADRLALLLATTSGDLRL